jgi:hypothetical protein
MVQKIIRLNPRLFQDLAESLVGWALPTNQAQAEQAFYMYRRSRDVIRSIVISHSIVNNKCPY